jgi:hypothetical protein
MQNLSIASRTTGTEQRVINYRPERPGYDFQRQSDANDADSLDNTYAAETTQQLITPFKLAPLGPATAKGRAANNKPFTLGHAIVSFTGIITVLIAGYLAYTTWIA